MALGILFGLTAAFIWSTTSLIVKVQAARFDTLSFNAFRVVIGWLFFLCLLPFFGGFALFGQVSPLTFLTLTVSVILGFCLGDSLYFWSLTKIGPSRAMPISGIYPVFTWLIAVPLLGEQVTVPAILGTILVVVSLFLLGREHSAEAAEGNDMLILPSDTAEPSTIPARTRYLGVGAAILTAFFWACSTTLLRVGIQMQEPVTVYDNLQQTVMIGVYRSFVAALFLLPAAQLLKGSQVWRPYRGAALVRLIALSIYSTGLGSLFFIMGVALAGAARAALMNSASPVIGVVLSWLILREHVTRWVWAGTALAVIGVWLVLT